MKKNDEKTSLFFALICRRAGRKDACIKWLQRYLSNQDEQDLDRNTVVILDAYASGLFGADSEGLISRQMTEWLAHLADEPGFTERQMSQWSETILQMRKPVDGSDYYYLRHYSPDWPVLEDVLEGAYLHAEFLGYLINVFDQKTTTATVTEQLDGVLTSLVTGFDSEEPDSSCRAGSKKPEGWLCTVLMRSLRSIRTAAGQSVMTERCR